MSIHLGSNNHSQNLGADLYPGSPLQYSVEGGNLVSMRVSYARRIRRITLQRYLSSQIAYNCDEASFQDILILYDNMLWCQEKAEKDPKFEEKFGDSLEELSKILKKFRFSQVNFVQTIRKLSSEIKKLENFLIPKRNLKGVKIHFLGKIHVLPSKRPGIDNKYLPQTTFIGKGYRDKGTLRDLARDGSPRWQELASALPLKTLEEILNENDKSNQD